MKTKRLISVVLLLLAISSVATAQRRLDIQLKNKSIVSCTLDDIDYMEIVEGAAPGELDGVWYLGWKVTNNGSGLNTHYNATETLVFTAGPRLKWIKSTGVTVYDLTYPESGAKEGLAFTGRTDGSNTNYTFQIVAMEEGLLVIKYNSVRYYFYNSREAAINSEYVSYPTRSTIYTDGAKLWASNVKGGATNSKITPMGKHFDNFPAATDEDKAWLANPSNQPDASWHELGGSWTSQTITLYPFGSPVPADVNQTNIGDCCMCAVFASFAYIYPDWIKTIIHKSGNNYTVNMFDPKGNPIDVVVDNKMLSSQVTGKNGKFCWSSILEKALMKWETCFKCNKIGGIGTEHAAPPFTGNGSSYSFSPDKLYNSEFDILVDYALSNGLISVGGFNVGGLLCGEMETITGHAFTLMYPDEGADYKFVMRNPWGSGYPTDGKLKIPARREVLRTIDFRLVYPGAQMAEYKKENLAGYTPPRFRPMYMDMNPSDEMLRMYRVENYVPFPIPEGKALDDFVEGIEE